jgi:hypothetical protein
MSRVGHFYRRINIILQHSSQFPIFHLCILVFPIKIKTDIIIKSFNIVCANHPALSFPATLGKGTFLKLGKILGKKCFILVNFRNLNILKNYIIQGFEVYSYMYDQITCQNI